MMAKFLKLKKEDFLSDMHHSNCCLVFSRTVGPRYLFTKLSWHLHLWWSTLEVGFQHEGVKFIILFYFTYGLFIYHDQVDDQDAAELGRLLVVNLVKIVLVVNLVVADEEPIR